MISIRFPEFSDKVAFIKAMRASEKLHYPWIDPPKNDIAFETFMQKYQCKENISYLIMHYQEIAGVVNINQIILGNFQSAFLGYYTVASFSGRGIMSKGFALVLEKAFTQHGLHRLEANIQPENSASIALVKRHSFVKEGFSKNYLRHHGKWCDHERWAITQEIFEDNCSNQ